MILAAQFSRFPFSPLSPSLSPLSLLPSLLPSLPLSPFLPLPLLPSSNPFFPQQVPSLPFLLPRPHSFLCDFLFPFLQQRSGCYLMAVYILWTTKARRHSGRTHDFPWLTSSPYPSALRSGTLTREWSTLWTTTQGPPLSKVSRTMSCSVLCWRSFPHLSW